MHFLIISPEGMYYKSESSFIHNQLVGLKRKGIEITAIVPMAFLKKDCEGRRVDYYRKRVVDGITIYYIRYLSFSSWGRRNINVLNAQISTYYFCVNYLKHVKFDLIWCHSIGFGSQIGKKIKSIYHIPLVITTHGGDTEEFIKKYNKRRIDISYIDLIIAVSNKLKKEVENLKIHVPIVTVVNGFKAENVVKNAVKRKEIIQVGHLISSKHFDITLKTLSELKKHGYIIKYNIVGVGSEKEHLERLASEYDVIDQVEFHGEKSNKDTLKMMSQAMFFVMPSYPEGLGIVYLEAMASGCITIGVKDEGIDGIIINSKNGYLIDRDDSNEISRIIEKCINDEKICRYISNNAKKTVRGYTWDNNVERCIKVIRENVKL